MTVGVVSGTSTDWRGGTLGVASLSGSTVLALEETVDFDEDGGWLVVGGSAPLEYVAFDEDAATVTLAAPVGAAHESGTPVNLWDPSVAGGGAQVVEYVATVDLSDGSGAVDAVIPHSMIPTSGVDYLVGASVRLFEAEDGEWYVGEVLGREARVDGALIGMPIQTSEDGERVVITAENNGAVLFYTGSVHEAVDGPGFITSSETDLGSTVLLQTAITGPKLDGAPGQPTLSMSSQDTSGVYLTSVVVTADRLTFNGDRIESTNLFLTAAPTTGGAANVNIGPGGQLRESTSALRYKQDIRAAKVDPAAVLKLQGKTWRDRNAVAADPDTTERHIGFIAEDLDALGLREFVDYVDGEPNAIQYDRLSVALLEVVKQQETRLSRIEAVLNLPKIGA